MTCPSCGAQAPSGAGFCPDCGARFKAIPVSCGEKRTAEQTERIAGREERKNALLVICLVVLAFAVSVPIILLLLSWQEKQDHAEDSAVLTSVPASLPENDPHDGTGRSADSPLPPEPAVSDAALRGQKDREEPTSGDGSEGSASGSETPERSGSAEAVSRSAALAAFNRDGDSFASLSYTQISWDTVLYAYDAPEYRDPQAVMEERSQALKAEYGSYTVDVTVLSSDVCPHRDAFLDTIAEGRGFLLSESGAWNASSTEYRKVLSLLADRTIRGVVEEYRIAVCALQVNGSLRSEELLIKVPLLRIDGRWAVFADPETFYEQEPVEPELPVIPIETKPWDVFQPSD